VTTQSTKVVQNRQSSSLRRDVKDAPPNAGILGMAAAVGRLAMINWPSPLTVLIAKCSFVVTLPLGDANRARRNTVGRATRWSAGGLNRAGAIRRHGS